MFHRFWNQCGASRFLLLISPRNLLPSFNGRPTLRYMCVPIVFMHSNVTDNDPSHSADADADLIFNVISRSCLSIEQNKA